MRIIPVLDLVSGQVVHALGGEREKYQPVQSVLCESAEPIQVARAFRAQLGLDTLYIADLDAIQDDHHHKKPAGHQDLIQTLARVEKFHILLDAGAGDAASAQGLLELGVSRVIIGAETLPHWEALQVLPGCLPAERLVFSLDMQAGKILSRCPELAALTPLAALEELQARGWREVILLDLKRVGSGSGVDQGLVTQARAKFPKMSLLIGGGLTGGVTGMAELLALKELGVAGVLMATALHRGTLDAEQVRLLR